MEATFIFFQKAGLAETWNTKTRYIYISGIETKHSLFMLNV